MRGIIKSSMEARLLVASITVIVIALGISQLYKAPYSIYPEFSPVYVEVQTEALGLSAEEVEQLLTVALEQDLFNGIAYLDEIWSESMPGLSRVVCVFEPGTDPLKARQVVTERLTQAHALPNVSAPPIMLQPYSSTSRVMKVGLSPTSPEVSLIDVSVLARWTIQPYLMGVEGVANVSIWGQRKRQLQIQVDPIELHKNGVTLDEVVETGGEALWFSPLTFLESSKPGTGGFFDTPNQRLGIRHLLPISTPEDLAKVSVSGHPDKQLSDISTVVENHQPLIGDAIVNGSPGLMLVVEKFPWANTAKVAEGVEEAMESLAPGLAGIAMDMEIYQPGNFIEASLGNLSVALLIGLLLSLLAMFLFLYQWRSAVIGFVAVVMSLLAGVYFLYVMGYSLNMMLFAGFIAALGVIIDDAITNIEHIRKRISEEVAQGKNKSTPTIVLQAVYQTRSPIMYATGVLLLAALPLFFVSGKAGAFYHPMALAYVTALLVSTVVALLITPALSVMLFSNGVSPHRESPLLVPLRAAFDNGVTRFIKKPAMAFITLGVVALGGLLALSMINLDPELPVPKEFDMVISWDAPYGTSHPEMTRVTTEAIQSLGKIPGIKNVAAHVGRAVLSDKITNVHSGEIWVSMDDDAARDHDQITEHIQEVLDGFPNITSKLQSYRDQVLNKRLRGTGHEYAVRVYGENQETLKTKAEEIKAAISSISGLHDAIVVDPPLEPNLEIEVDLERARRHNIKPGDVRRTAAILLAGIEVGYLFEGQKVFDVVVWGKPEVRNDINAVRNLLIDKPGGGQVLLSEVAHVREVETPAVIHREMVSRYRDVVFNIPKSMAPTLNTEIDRALAHVDFPLEYHAELVGDYASQQESKSTVWSVVIACLIGILLILQACFWSWRMSLVVFPTLLITVSGGLVMVWLTGGQMTAGALAGLFGILGLATNQGILLIKRFKNLEVIEGMEFGEDLVKKGFQERLGPILMSILTVALVMLPFVFFGSAPGMEVFHPMSMVMLGGLVTILLLNVFVLPALYHQFGKVSDSILEEEKAMLEHDLAPSI